MIYAVRHTATTLIKVRSNIETLNDKRASIIAVTPEPRWHTIEEIAQRLSANNIPYENFKEIQDIASWLYQREYVQLATYRTRDGKLYKDEFEYKFELQSDAPLRIGRASLMWSKPYVIAHHDFPQVDIQVNFQRFDGSTFSVVESLTDEESSQLQQLMDSIALRLANDTGRNRS